MKRILTILMASLCLFYLVGCGAEPPLRAPYALLGGEVVINYEFTYSDDELSEAAEELFIAYFSDEDDEVYMLTAALPPEMCKTGLSVSLEELTDGAELRLIHVGEEIKEYSTADTPEVFSAAELRLESYSEGATAQFYIKAEFTVDGETLSYEGCSDILMHE